MDWRTDDRGSLCRVSPFRNPRLNGYLLLTAAYRSLSRLSSALSAKASTLRSFQLNLFIDGTFLSDCSSYVEPLPSSVTLAVRFLHSGCLDCVVLCPLRLKTSNNLIDSIESFFSMKFSRYIAVSCGMHFCMHAFVPDFSGRFLGGYIAS